MEFGWNPSTWASLKPFCLGEDAARFHQTLVGFARNGGFNVYSAPERVE